jgi:branched-chain amino acid transport system permease protein
MEHILLISVFGISYGFVLFLAAFALSIAIGTMGIINVAHGAIFMIGGFTGVTIARETNSYLLGMLGGGAASGAVALLIEEIFLRRFYKQGLQQVLLLFGWTYILVNLALWVWGPTSRIASPPRLFSGSITVAGAPLPVYRLVLIGAGIIAFVILWWLQEKTRFGAIVRAGMDDAEMVSALGIRLRPITAGAFCFALALAGVAAVMASPVLGGISLWTSSNILFLSLCVSIIGGVGKVQGTLAGSLLVGVLFVWVATYFPALPVIATYIALVIVLILRPRGLLGRAW